MNYTPHICDPAGFTCSGGNENPHVCEVDSVHQGACDVCAQYPTDPRILRIVMQEHAAYPDGEKTICYRDKSREPQTCQCPIFSLMNNGHQKGCSKK